MSIWYTYKNR